MSLKGKVLPKTAKTHNYFEELMKDEKLKSILDFIQRRKNLRIEFVEKSRRDSLVDQRGESTELYNNCYLDNKIIVEMIEDSNNNGERLIFLN